MPRGDGTGGPKSSDPETWGHFVLADKRTVRVYHKGVGRVDRQRLHDALLSSEDLTIIKKHNQASTARPDTGNLESRKTNLSDIGQPENLEAHLKRNLKT